MASAGKTRRGFFVGPELVRLRRLARAAYKEAWTTRAFFRSPSEEGSSRSDKEVERSGIQKEAVPKSNKPFSAPDRPTLPKRECVRKTNPDHIKE